MNEASSTVRVAKLLFLDAFAGDALNILSRHVFMHVDFELLTLRSRIMFKAGR